jgi:dTDP-D-glucose 4,6-dehydratase
MSANGFYVGDCAQAVWTVLLKGKIGEAYNIGSGQEKKNIETVKMILESHVSTQKTCSNSSKTAPRTISGIR